MICKKCGAIISDDAKFCTTCGETMEVAAEIPTDTFEHPVTESSFVEMPTYDDFANGSVYRQPVYAEKVTDSGKNFAIASLILGIIGVVNGYSAICCCNVFTGTITLVPAIVGLILAIVAKKKGTVGGIQKAGLVLNIISIVVYIVVLILTVVFVYGIYSGIIEMGNSIVEFFEEIEKEVEDGLSADVESHGQSAYYAIRNFLK